MISRFVEYTGDIYRVLLETADGAWLIAYALAREPFFVSAANLTAYTAIPAPEGFVQAIKTHGTMSEAQVRRLRMIEPLVADDQYICAPKARRRKAQEIADANGVTVRTVLRLYFRYISSGVILENKPREHRRNPEFERAIQRYYYSSRQFSLRGTYEMMILEHYMDDTGQIKEDAPSYHTFRHYFYDHRLHQLPQKIIAREGLSAYQRDHRLTLGSGPGWRDRLGCYQMDATLADIYLVSRLDRSTVIGRPNIYLAVDTMTQLIAGVYVGLDAGETAVMACIAQATGDKVEFCRRYGISITEAQWPNTGIPREIITDKGREFCRNRVEELALRYGVVIQNLPPYRPDRKGLVEKAFDLIQERYKPLLRGRGVIEEDAQERWAVDYRAQASLTLDEFTAIVVHAILFLNSGRLLSTGITPAQQWLEVEDSLLQVDSEELSCMGLPRTTVKMGRKGIRHRKMWYVPSDRDLLHPGETYTIAYDPSDVSCIYVVLDGQYYPCRLGPADQRYQGAGAVEAAMAQQALQQQVRQRRRAAQAASIAATQAIRDIAAQASGAAQGEQNGQEIQRSREAERSHLAW
ncbi:transposase family protein [Intestinimonas massiliensis (ex Afouda et al. 2020)]|uniref:transposase family protein n=1 Tax=Intestinimonas massiliensis (ex Afouda et al. 2020) TaxID=1673721 RepID=UPI001F5E5735|nr:transposase family protein [Intestinimonas massiliensis (ex Afouda et al. 2020)]